MNQKNIKFQKNTYESDILMITFSKMFHWLWINASYFSD